MVYALPKSVIVLPSLRFLIFHTCSLMNSCNRHTDWQNFAMSWPLYSTPYSRHIKHRTERSDFLSSHVAMNAGYSFLSEGFGGPELRFCSRDRFDGTKVITLRRIFVYQEAHVIMYSVPCQRTLSYEVAMADSLLSHKWRSWPANHVCQIEFQGIKHYAIIPLFDWLTWWEVSQILCEIWSAEFDTFAPPSTTEKIKSAFTCSPILISRIKTYSSYSLCA